MESENLYNDQLFVNLIKSYLAQLDSAVKISAILNEHSEDKELTGDDIICGLVYRLMVPMTKEEIDQSLNNADEVLNDIDDEDYDNIEETYKKPNISKQIKTNNCNCDICSKVRVCLINYKDYEPIDDLAIKFKNSITETCHKHNIYI
jgi:hypothetical protein